MTKKVPNANGEMVTDVKATVHDVLAKAKSVKASGAKVTVRVERASVKKVHALAVMVNAEMEHGAKANGLVKASGVKVIGLDRHAKASGAKASGAKVIGVARKLADQTQSYSE